ncbi:hypothetical protein VNO77_39228 [Canavalia gladiata]|uniref:Uncharacterized protein n=1 Tax=Canavalia gladiata TaxID=3824 RepID=A0AAN9KA37_CANGL
MMRDSNGEPGRCKRRVCHCAKRSLEDEDQPYHDSFYFNDVSLTENRASIIEAIPSFLSRISARLREWLNQHLSDRRAFRTHRQEFYSTGLPQYL